MHGADDLGMLLGKVEEGTAVQEDLVVAGLRSEPLLVEQSHDVFGCLLVRRRSERRAPGGDISAPLSSGPFRLRCRVRLTRQGRREHRGEQPELVLARCSRIRAQRVQRPRPPRGAASRATGGDDAGVGEDAKVPANRVGMKTQPPAELVRIDSGCLAP